MSLCALQFSPGGRKAYTVLRAAGSSHHSVSVLQQVICWNKLIQELILSLFFLFKLYISVEKRAWWKESLSHYVTLWHIPETGQQKASISQEWRHPAMKTHTLSQWDLDPGEHLLKGLRSHFYGSPFWGTGRIWPNMNCCAVIPRADSQPPAHHSTVVTTSWMVSTSLNVLTVVSSATVSKTSASEA